nr:cysteine-rich receptor-like protein kinase [Tanacetum cinerariifolium]
MNILSLNIQGLGHKTKKVWIKELTSKNKINFMAIQETKTHCVNHMDVKFMWGNSNYNYVYREAVGNSGGILCVWEATVFKKDYATISDNFVIIYGTWLPSNSKVKEAFFKHFEARFKKPVNHRLKINFLFSKRLTDVQASDLERRVSHDEIQLAVWNCGENKSPGPDGYSSFPNGCNSSFVALILKITDAKFINDFRPISLIGSVYKVVTKVLANRLALVISDLISDTQSAFVANRQILDGPFILNELLHWCKRKKKQVIFFKVDFVKAYDSVRWDYLLDVLEAFEFGNIWCKWIRGTFSSAKASVLVN